ncbi:MAG: ParB/RepB/Spo0J family partition protein [Candidatus Nanopelagicales bacterium]|nr:ParB/RepB/Spo0J family partition protein [Candidatus Nanopelagicales bacterium]MCF8537261.1 ParB/RepB/Spo0J family partition protein [Candidatus Nanopelagicales bacterium]MCF8543155.1 ParB/RepB/Spo0J family partition protein [Candidatus Nanopelagicales bacterium]MCF8558007.1 ParB/RepB/Spo0J family partition protein [Candidatus Nanopelagicales bacterium]
MASAPKRGLGKGLGALIPSGPAPVAHPDQPGEPAARPSSESEMAPIAGATYAELPIGAIAPNPRQPRTVFDEEALAELVFSIKEIGLLQPIVVRDVGDEQFELIAGERRLRASKEAGLASIPAIIRATDDEDLLRDALLENLHRANLNALEEAAAYQQLLSDFGCTQEELARRIGRSRPQVSNTLRLLKLPPDVQRRVAAGVLSAGHARALLSLDDPAAMEVLAARIVAEGLSVRSVEEIIIVGDGDGRSRSRKSRSRGSAKPDAEVAEVVAELTDRASDALDTRITAKGFGTKRARGTLVIECADIEDLRRIVDLLD